MDLANDELKATKNLFFSDKNKINKALNQIYVYKTDALINADETAFNILDDIEKILKGG